MALFAAAGSAAAVEPALDPANNDRLLSLLRVPPVGDPDFQALEVEDARRLAGDDGSRLVLAELYGVRSAARDASPLLLAETGHLADRFGGGAFSDALFAFMPGQKVQWKQTLGPGPAKYVEIQGAPGVGRLESFYYFWFPFFRPTDDPTCTGELGASRPQTGFVLRSSRVDRPPNGAEAYRGSACGVLPASFYTSPFLSPDTLALRDADANQQQDFPGDVGTGSGNYAGLQAKFYSELDFTRTLSISNMTHQSPWGNLPTEWVDFPIQDNALLPPRPANSDEELALARATLLKPQAAEIRQWINWRLDPGHYSRPGTWSGDVSITSDRTFTDTAHPAANLTIHLTQKLREPYELTLYGPGRRAMGRWNSGSNPSLGGIGDDTSVSVAVIPGNPVRRYTAYVSYDTPVIAPPARILARDTIDINVNHEPLYVAIGDSFSSGLGTANGYDRGTRETDRPLFPSPFDPIAAWHEPGPWTDCWRSNDAYPHLITDSNFVASESLPYAVVPYQVRHVACQGWTAADVADSRKSVVDSRGLVGDGSQLSYLNSRTRLVTVGLGGNDANFADTLKRCNTYPLQGGTGPCIRFDASTKKLIRDLTKPLNGDKFSALARLYRNIKYSRAKNARVLVGGYARFWPNPGGPRGLVFGRDGCGVRMTDKPWMNSMIQLLNKGIADSAKAAGVDYVDLYEASAGHEMCGQDRSTDYQHAGRGGPFGGDSIESYHPTRYGQRQIARAYLKRLAQPRTPSVPIRPGQTIRRTIVVASASPILGVNTTWPGSDVVTTLTSPSGRIIDRQTVADDVLHDVSETVENYMIADPEPGTWQVDIYGADVAPEGEQVIVDLFAAEPDNQEPTARASVTQSGSAVSVDASASTDPESGQLTYLWDFGDGTAANERVGTHTYTAPGIYIVTLTVMDPAGFVGVYENPPVTVAGDSTPPTVTITSPTDGQPLVKGGSVAAAFSCADSGGSGLASCTGTVANGSPLDTATVGQKTLTVTATDNAGNTTTVTRSYSVTYQFTGFVQPVDNQPTVNTVNAGRAIPVKFSLGGNQGLSIFAAGSPTVQTISCTTGTPTSEIETTVNAGGSSLSYSSGNQQYNYVWKTDSAWAGTCRRLILTLNDGTRHEADFKFR